MEMIKKLQELKPANISPELLDALSTMTHVIIDWKTMRSSMTDQILRETHLFQKYLDSNSELRIYVDAMVEYKGYRTNVNFVETESQILKVLRVRLEHTIEYLGQQDGE